MTHTHTYATLPVDPISFEFVCLKLIDAGYNSQVDLEEQIIDMKGLALTVKPLDSKILHPSIEALLKFFKFKHLPENLQHISRPFSIMAYELAYTLPSNAETTITLRKLIEAKDAAVRSALDL